MTSVSESFDFDTLPTRLKMAIIEMENVSKHPVFDTRIIPHPDPGFLVLKLTGLRAHLQSNRIDYSLT
jgi:hypothetical protein